MGTTAGSNTKYPADKAFLLPALAAVLLAPFFFLMCSRSLHASGPVWAEGVLVGLMESLRSGRLYDADALRHPPYSVLTHTPLSYILEYAAYRIYPGFQAMRLVNMLVTTLCGVVIALFVRRAGRPTESALFAGLVFVLMPPVFFSAQTARAVDSLCCLFSLLALAALQFSVPQRRDWLVSVLAAGAILSKQTAVLSVLPAIVLSDLFVFRNPRLAVRHMILTLAAVLPVLAILQWTSHGGFLTNVVRANLTGFVAVQWTDAVIKQLWPMWLFTAALGLYRPWRISVPLVWFLVSASYGLATVGKTGSNLVYFFDASAALSLLAGLRNTSRKVSGTGRTPANLALVCALIVLFVAGDWPWTWLADPRFSDSYARLIDDVRHRQYPGKTLLSEDAAIPAAIGEHPWLDDPFVLTSLARAGLFSDEETVRALRERRFFAVVISDPAVWTPREWAELWRNYQPGPAFLVPTGTDTVMLPKPGR